MPQLPAAQAASGVLTRIMTFLRDEPLLAAAAAVGVVVLLFIVWRVLRWVRRPPGLRFQRALAGEERLTILMHPNPDPDAMATALGVAHIADRVDTGSVIQYPGQIRHQENRAFQTVLDLSFDAIEELGEMVDDPVVLVDHNEARGFAGSEGIEPYAVVDHHPGEGSGTAFTDVRSEYGACATIVAEYLDELGLVPADPDVEGNGDAGRIFPSTVATGLMYGILADTNHLTQGCTRAEFEASAYLFPGVDEDLLHRIANPEVDAEVLEVTARAIADRDVRGPFAVSDVGTLSNVDAVPQAADELLQLEGVTAVVVFGEKNGTLHLSGRSRDDRVHMGKALKNVVADIPMADAGGHARMGGGQVSLEHMVGIGPSSGVSRMDLADKLFDAMAGDV